MLKETQRRKIMSRDFQYNLRTIIGFLLIILGVIGGLRFAWWLSFEGDIIETLHAIKMGLPGWAWIVLKFALSGAFGVLFIALFVIVAIIVFSGGGQKQ